MTYRSKRVWRAFFVAGIAGIGLAAAAGPANGAQAPGAANAPANAPAPAPSGQAYAIKFTRPVKVGDRYRYVSDASVVNTLTGNVSGRERSFKPTAVTIHLQAVERVLAVNTRGEPTKAEYTIESCVSHGANNKDHVLLKPWRVLTVESAPWKSRLTLDEGNISLAEDILLRAVVSLPNLKGVTADDCFAPAKPQRIGDTWPVNAEALAKLASENGLIVNKQQVSGTVKLKGIQLVDGVPHLLVQGKAVFDKWLPDPLDMPKGAQFVKGTREIKFTRLLPVDLNGNCLTDSNSERLAAQLKTEDGGIDPDIRADLKILRTFGVKRTPLPATGTVTATASGQE
jgi:hypothetical protein